MAVIIGDIHGNLNKARAFLAYKPEAEHVALGDYVDSFTESAALQIACLKLLLESDCVLLWGNHDLHYLPERPWICSGYQFEHAHLFRDMYATALQDKRLKAAYAIDGWLCTHAGVSPGMADLIPEENRCSSTAAEWLNAEFERTRLEPQYWSVPNEHPNVSGSSPLFNISRVRGGRDSFGGIFWYDPFRENTKPSPLVGKQLFGHTERPEPKGLPGEWWDLDTTNSSSCWIFDTTGESPQIIPSLTSNGTKE